MAIQLVVVADLTLNCIYLLYILNTAYLFSGGSPQGKHCVFSAHSVRSAFPPHLPRPILPSPPPPLSDAAEVPLPTILQARTMQNPALSGRGQHPVPMNGELFILSRSGISFSAKCGRQTFEGSGDLYLSTLRLVFVNKVPRTCPALRCCSLCFWWCMLDTYASHARRHVPTGQWQP